MLALTFYLKKKVYKKISYEKNNFENLVNNEYKSFIKTRKSVQMSKKMLWKWNDSQNYFPVY